MGIQQALGGSQREERGLMLLQTVLPGWVLSPARLVPLGSSQQHQAGRAGPPQTPPWVPCGSAAAVPSSPGDSSPGGGSAHHSPNPCKGVRPVPALLVRTRRRSGHPRGLWEPSAPGCNRGAQPCRPAGQRGPAESGQQSSSERFSIDRNLIPNPRLTR